MTFEQHSLLGDVETVTETGRPLTPNQQLAWDSIRASANGLYADEVGALIHRRHRNDERCEYCGRDGLAVLRSKGLAPLVIRRRSGLWQPRDPKDAAHVAPAGLIATSETDPALNPFADL